ncbi:craniofacial development protein 2-like [Patiria miniata]|uniref:Endonuclease/exonuclease/phosphatase domain-containing protein n=1 Tax=Patiria miniata TaxID=46514 RepID=A0A913ZR63_PATMI|nr:craniofacial development protein 2-like [Patiria miniata]
MTRNKPNPILPAAGVRRKTAAGRGTGPNGLHDGGSLNPDHSGRDQPDSRAKTTVQLLKCKRNLTFSTFNACTIREMSRATASCSRRCSVDVLGIQEHRRVHPDEEIRFDMVKGVDLITSSAWRNPTTRAAVGGVGLLLSRRARKALQSVNSLSPRVLVATFDGNPATTVVVASSPHNHSEEADVEQFYLDLRAVAEQVPVHHFLTFLGDFNAWIGRDDALFTYHDETNRNGEHLVSFIEEHNLLAANTMFQKRPSKFWTHKDRASDDKCQLNYILVRRKWRNSVVNAEAFSTFETVNSDHRVVSMKVKLSLRRPKASKPKERVDWRMFSTHAEL